MIIEATSETECYGSSASASLNRRVALSKSSCSVLPSGGGGGSSPNASASSSNRNRSASGTCTAATENTGSKAISHRSQSPGSGTTEDCLILDVYVPQDRNGATRVPCNSCCGTAAVTNMDPVWVCWREQGWLWVRTHRSAFQSRYHCRALQFSNRHSGLLRGSVFNGRILISY